jgi:hypothetical protein
MIVCDICQKKSKSERAEYSLSIGYRSDKNFQGFDLCQAHFDKAMEYFFDDAEKVRDNTGKAKKISL